MVYLLTRCQIMTRKKNFMIQELLELFEVLKGKSKFILEFVYIEIYLLKNFVSNRIFYNKEVAIVVPESFQKKLSKFQMVTVSNK